MSTRRPAARTPLSPGVYWRRRTMVAGTAVLLVVAGVDLANGGDSGPSDTAQRVVARPTGDPGDAATTRVRTGKGAKKKNKKNQQAAEPAEPVYTPPPAPPPAEPDGACGNDDITITPVMGSAVAGRAVLVSLQLQTREAEACTWTISSDHLAYKITDGDGEDVWSSSQCPGQVPEDEIVVRSAMIATYRLAWNARSSSLDCPASMGFVDPGDYAVQAAAIGGEPSDVVSFKLADAADLVTNDEPLGPPVPETGQTKNNGAKNKGAKNKGKSKPVRG